MTTIEIKEYQRRPYLPEKLSEPPFTTLGLFTYTRTYSREMENGKRETWLDTIERVIDSANSQLGCDFTVEEQTKLFYYLYNLKFSVAGRFMWCLGSKTVEKHGFMALQNCAAIDVDHIRAFENLFDMLCLGTGVGFTVERDSINKLPVVKHVEHIRRRDGPDADFIVPDSRDGWRKLISKLFKAHFYSGHAFEYSCHCIRSKGAKISGFGGEASGPDMLVNGIAQMHELLNNKAGQQLSSCDVMDLCCIIASIVVAGNIRRSSLICISDHDDNDYLLAKNWGNGNIPNWRCFSNNTVVCNDITEILDNDVFWKNFDGSSEPYGLFNRTLSQRCGRSGDFRFPDAKAKIPNPCAEIILSSYQTCCLSELFLPNIESKEELQEILSFAYRICKKSLALKCHIAESERIVHEQFRIGVGVTGICQCSDEKLSWLSDGYEYLRTYDSEYSVANNMPASIKLTTTKPSGSLSLLGGCTPGVHGAYSQYYIRRVRFSSDNPLIKIAEQNGYKTEFVKNFDGSTDYLTKIIEFPSKAPDGSKLACDMSAVEQLNLVKKMQHIWADNAVSNTVTYKLEELPEIKEWLRENYNDNIKSVSFLLHSNHGFQQAPYEPIDEETYNTLVAGVNVIRYINSDILFSKEVESKEEQILDQGDCAGGACPIR